MCALACSPDRNSYSKQFLRTWAPGAQANAANPSRTPNRPTPLLRLPATRLPRPNPRQSILKPRKKKKPPARAAGTRNPIFPERRRPRFARRRTRRLKTRPRVRAQNDSPYMPPMWSGRGPSAWNAKSRGAAPPCCWGCGCDCAAAAAAAACCCWYGSDALHQSSRGGDANSGAGPEDGASEDMSGAAKGMVVWGGRAVAASSSGEALVVRVWWCMAVVGSACRVVSGSGRGLRACRPGKRPAVETVMGMRLYPGKSE